MGLNLRQDLPRALRTAAAVGNLEVVQLLWNRLRGCIELMLKEGTSPPRAWIDAADTAFTRAITSFWTSKTEAERERQIAVIRYLLTRGACVQEATRWLRDIIDNRSRYLTRDALQLVTRLYQALAASSGFWFRYMIRLLYHFRWYAMRI